MGMRADAQVASGKMRSSPRYLPGITSPPAERIVSIHPRAGVSCFAPHRADRRSEFSPPLEECLAPPAVRITSLHYPENLGCSGIWESEAKLTAQLPAGPARRPLDLLGGRSPSSMSGREALW